MATGIETNVELFTQFTHSTMVNFLLHPDRSPPGATPPCGSNTNPVTTPVEV